MKYILEIYCCHPALSTLLAIPLMNFQMIAIQIHVFQMVSRLFRNRNCDRNEANPTR